MNSKRVICVILVCRGSEGIFQEDIMDFCGKPVPASTNIQTNDVNELEVMKIVGFPVVPAGAQVEIKPVAKLATRAGGGYGVIRGLSVQVVVPELKVWG